MKSMFNNLVFESRPTAKLSRLVFESDKRFYTKIIRTKIKNTDLFSQFVDRIEEINFDDFQYIHSDEPETRFNYEVYKDDADRLNLLYEGKLKNVGFKYLFRSFVNDIKSQLK